MSAIEWIISIILLLGALLCLLAAFGINRLPDVYSRLHAAGKSSTLGTASLLLATFLYFLFVQEQFVGKIMLTIIFIFITSPMAALMIARSAHRVGVPFSDKNGRDDLRETYKKDEHPK
ncbi:monovalent cation/H(+) antiporter subunit G [Alkalicoccobacillus gibsonii]|uniref:Monovalent cation/H(+) antiporter subunit G n=1 Tax=Alkalicoccobacillus gibsonii TaxID=79881 RepID=A0ABU9VIJ9_9BACI